jgi:hypothetical protein
MLYAEGSSSVSQRLKLAYNIGLKSKINFAFFVR